MMMMMMMIVVVAVVNTVPLSVSVWQVWPTATWKMPENFRSPTSSPPTTTTSTTSATRQCWSVRWRTWGERRWVRMCAGLRSKGQSSEGLWVIYVCAGPVRFMVNTSFWRERNTRTTVRNTLIQIHAVTRRSWWTACQNVTVVWSDSSLHAVTRCSWWTACQNVTVVWSDSSLHAVTRCSWWTACQNMTLVWSVSSTKKKKKEKIG